MPYKYLENVAIADVCFEAKAKTVEELFEECALATSEVMVNTKTVKQKIKKTIQLKSDSIDNLLFDFLSEIVFMKDTDSLLFSKFAVKIKKFSLEATLEGDKISKEQELRNDVKAVTLHMFEVKKEEGAWFARMVLDI